MPTARRMATPRNSATTATKQSRADLAVAEGRQHDVVGRPAEHPGVGDGQRPEQQAADRGEGEDPLLALDRDPQDGEPLAGGRALVHVSPPSSSLPDRQPVRLATLFPRHRTGWQSPDASCPGMMGAWSAGSPRSERRTRVGSGGRSPRPRSASVPTRPTLLRRLGHQGPGLPPARPREQPRRRPGDRRVGPVRPDGQGDGAAEEAAVREARGPAAQQQLHLLRAAAGRRDGQHVGVLRAPRGHPARAAPGWRRRTLSDGLARHPVAGPEGAGRRARPARGSPGRRTTDGHRRDGHPDAGPEPGRAVRPGDRDRLLPVRPRRGARPDVRRPEDKVAKVRRADFGF